MKILRMIVAGILLTTCLFSMAYCKKNDISNNADEKTDHLPTPVAEWRFDDPQDLTHATVGNDLMLNGVHSAIDGPLPENGAIRIGSGSYYRLSHDIKPKANQTYINEYAILFDFKISDINNWHSFLQTSQANEDDAELFIRYPQGTIGLSDTGYSYRKVSVNQWYRMIMVVDNGNEYSLYLDGEKILTGQPQDVDGRFSLRPEILLFGDNDGEDDWIDIAQVSLYDYALTTADVQLLCQQELSSNPFLTQPWLQNVTPNGITVMWETNTPAEGTLTYGTTKNFGSKIIPSNVATNANTYINKTILSNLEPDTKYFYEVEVDSTTSEIRSFVTAPSAKDASFKVALWSDSHYAHPWSKMANYIVQTITPDFAINAGDISNSGNKRDDLATAFLPYVCGTIGSSIPFYTTFGNHDVGSHWGGGDLIRQYHDLPDEVNSDPDSFNGSYMLMYSNVAFISIDWDNMENDLRPGGWLENVLQSEQVENARFRFIIIHCAPYYERWQSAEIPTVKNNLPSLAEKYKVNAVISGHMHAYERGIKGGVNYITTGGGSYIDINEPVGPVIYEHIIRGTNKPDNPPNFNNGLSNNVLTIEIEELKANVSLHYFNSEGEYEDVIEVVEINNQEGK